MAATPEQNQQLRYAAKAGDLALVQSLVAAGAEINQAGTESPLYFAAQENKLEVLSWLLANGAKVDIGNAKKSTPLMGAAYAGHLGAVKLLMAAGADPDLRNNDNSSAKSYAANKPEILAWLNRNPHEVVLTRRVGDRTMQEIFNFLHNERITFIRKDAASPVEAVTRESFYELADKSALRRAFDQYRMEGGKRSEEEVFHSALPKLSLKGTQP
ncbi:MAG TPA: ankyrin repeat domain-containing protein [Patescibacteria group bacterium]|nr:ankyrin repeat domain-containing protein [Patescibacteria group bacterium]